MQMRQKQLPERQVQVLFFENFVEFLQNIFNPRLVESEDLEPRTHDGM